MSTTKKIIIEALLLGVVGFGVGATANEVREKGSLDWWENYFPPPPPPPPGPDDDESDIIDGGSGSELTPPEIVEVETPDHGLQTVTFKQVESAFNNPNPGAVVFVDARNDDAYEEGHIPGAVQADRYNLEYYIDNVLDAAEGAEQVIVYCNGGDCEDSIFLARDLQGFEVPYSVIYLYEGGWQDWLEHDMPGEKGRVGAEDQE